jgi:hypothetical protein
MILFIPKDTQFLNQGAGFFRARVMSFNAQIARWPSKSRKFSQLKGSILSEMKEKVVRSWKSRGTFSDDAR